jgi:hypothetical protein
MHMNASLEGGSIRKILGFTAVTMKAAVFWDVDNQLVPHRRYITSQVQSPAG